MLWHMHIQPALHVWHRMRALWAIATDVMVSVLGTSVSPAQTTKPIEMPFEGRLTWAQGIVCYMRLRSQNSHI